MADIDMQEVKEKVNVILLDNLASKTFASGKTGFYANGKITINGKRYQSQIMLVEIAEKTATKGKKK